MQQITGCIRAIADFPEPGVTFRDITPLLKNSDAMRVAVTQLAEPFRNAGVACVAGMEARGFIFGSLVAAELQCGFVPLRKVGKLPWITVRADYELEYGQSALEMHEDAVMKGERVLIVDDLIATGGTAAASAQLLRSVGATVVGCAFLIELVELNGRDLLSDIKIHSVVEYA